MRQDVEKDKCRPPGLVRGNQLSPSDSMEQGDERFLHELLNFYLSSGAQRPHLETVFLNESGKILRITKIKEILLNHNE